MKKKPAPINQRALETLLLLFGGLEEVKKAMNTPFTNTEVMRFHYGTIGLLLLYLDTLEHEILGRSTLFIAKTIYEEKTRKTHKTHKTRKPKFGQHSHGE